jgi:hypothetical protein
MTMFRASESDIYREASEERQAFLLRPLRDLCGSKVLPD